MNILVYNLPRANTTGLKCKIPIVLKRRKDPSTVTYETAKEPARPDLALTLFNCLYFLKS